MSGVSLGARGLTRAYRKGGFALHVDALEVAAGEVLAVLGPSGSGKSTLLTLLGLLERPDAGDVLLDGAPASSRDRAQRLRMAAVFQRPYLFKGTVAANVAYGLSVRGVPHAERPARVAVALERVGLGGYGSRSALTLSGGEAQRVSLARALVVEPSVLLLDEPLANLDPLLKRRLTHDFASILRQAGVTVVYVTHDQDEALVVADTAVILDAGRIVASGRAEEVLALPADPWTAAFLGREEALRGRVTACDDGLVRIDVAGQDVYATGEAAPGAAVRVAIAPEDVLLFEPCAVLPASTARNRIPARVCDVSLSGATNQVVLEAGGMRLAARVSRAATTELGLAPGVDVLAVFKASAVSWRIDRREG